MTDIEAIREAYRRWLGPNHTYSSGPMADVWEMVATLIAALDEARAGLEKAWGYNREMVMKMDAYGDERDAARADAKRLAEASERLVQLVAEYLQHRSYRGMTEAVSSLREALRLHDEAYIESMGGAGHAQAGRTELE